MAELTVPETLELLDRHGVPDPAYHVWADRYGLPPKSVADGVELLALGEPAGWELGGTINTFSYLVWAVWLIAFGVTLLVRGVRPVLAEPAPPLALSAAR